MKAIDEASKEHPSNYFLFEQKNNDHWCRIVDPIEFLFNNFKSWYIVKEVCCISWFFRFKFYYKDL